LSVYYLAEDNPWWRPDFLSYLEELRGRLRGLPEEEVRYRARLPLLGRLSDIDPMLRELKAEGEFDLRRVYRPRLLYLLRENLAGDARGGYTILSLRGPRRVGKTTSIKLLVAELLIESLIRPDLFNPLKIAYVRCDAYWVRSYRDLVEALRELLARREAHPGEFYLFLDEVSTLKNWQLAVKDLYDSGQLAKHKAKVLVAGSHRLDVKRGAEALALRRGLMFEGGNDKLYLPMKFPEYVAYREELSGRKELLSILTWEGFIKAEARREAFKELIDPDGNIPRLIEHLEPYLDTLYAYLDDYFVTGGYPLAILQYVERGRIAPEVYFEYVDLMVKDAARWGLSEELLLSVIHELLAPPLGPCSTTPIKEVSLNALAGRVGVSHNTVKNYLDYLVEAFVLHEVSKLKDPARLTTTPKTPKKYYFWDPLICTALRSITYGVGDPYTLAAQRISEWKPTLLETCTVINVAHLSMSLEVFQDLRLLRRKTYYYKSRTGREIDLMLHFMDKLVPIEVYAGHRPNAAHIKKVDEVSRQLRVRGLLVHGGRELRVSKNYVLIPAPLLLALA